MIVRTDLTYTLTAKPQVYAGFCNNLSHSGIHFSTQNTLDEGTSLEIIIAPQGNKITPLKATVEVIRIDPSADNTIGVAGKILAYK